MASMNGSVGRIRIPEALRHSIPGLIEPARLHLRTGFQHLARCSRCFIGCNRSMTRWAGPRLESPGSDTDACRRRGICWRDDVLPRSISKHAFELAMVRSRFFKSPLKRKSLQSMVGCSIIRSSSRRPKMTARPDGGVWSRPFEPLPSTPWSSMVPDSLRLTAVGFRSPSRKESGVMNHRCSCSWSVRHANAWCGPPRSRGGRSRRHRPNARTILESRGGRSGFFGHECRKLRLPWKTRSSDRFMPSGTFISMDRRNGLNRLLPLWFLLSLPLARRLPVIRSDRSKRRLMSTRFLSIRFPWLATDLARRRRVRRATGRPRRKTRDSSKKSSFPQSGDKELLVVAAGMESDRGRPILVVGTHRGGRRVLECCSAAVRRGIRPGMTLAEAKSLAMPEAEQGARSSPKSGRQEFSDEGGVLVVSPTPDRDQVDLRRLAEKCLRFAPITATDGPAGILLDLTGCRRVLDRRGGESGLLDRIEQAFNGAKIHVTAAVADTAVAARAWAEYRQEAEKADEHLDSKIIPPGRQADFLGSLPVECLGFSSETLEAIHEVNVRTVRQLQRLPRASLPVRYGGDVLCRLDQAMGRLPMVIEPVRPRIAVSERVEFNGPVRSRQAIEIAIADLLHRVRRRLEDLESGARILRIRIERPDLPDWIRGVELSRATRRREHLWMMLQPVIERLPLDHGVDSIELEIPRHRRLRHEPATMIEGSTNDERVSIRETEADQAAFVDLIQSRFGSRSVQQAAGLSGHVPEDEARIEPVERKEGRASPSFQIGPPARALRPTVLHRPPIPVEVECRGVIPTTVVRDDASWIVDVAEGPECIGAPWWRSAGADSTRARSGTGREPQRHYWRLRIDSGTWIWIFKSWSTGRWFLHGTWA